MKNEKEGGVSEAQQKRPRCSVKGCKRVSFAFLSSIRGNVCGECHTRILESYDKKGDRDERVDHHDATEA